MTQTNQISRDRWDTVTFRINTTAGTGFVHILENSPGNIHKVFFQVGKGGSDLNATLNALADLVTTLFKQGKGLSEVIAHLSGYTSDKLVIHNEIKGNKNTSYELHSLPEALMFALMQYRAGLNDVGDNPKFRMRG
jgi:hypothetical protein